MTFRSIGEVAAKMVEEYCPPQPVAFHPLAEIFPWIDGPALAALREDIRANGVREPIVFMDSAIIDGRNRYMCARDLGIKYSRREFGSDPADGDDPVAFVLSRNLHRRHLTESQRANVAARLANLKHGDTSRFSQGANLPLGENGPSQAVTVAAAAEMLKVSERSVKAARKVQHEGAPELAAAVDRGEVSVSAAAIVAELPHEEQAAVVAEGPKAVKAKAKAVREQKAAPEPSPPDEDPATAKVRRDLAKLTPAALIDEVIGLRADLADIKAERKSLKAENDSLKAQLRDALDSESGEVIRRLNASLKNAESAKWRATEEQGRLQKQIYALKKRVEELEAMGIAI